MHYRQNEFQNFLQNLPLDAHDALHRKSRPTLAFIRHCLRVGGGGNDKLAIDKAGNLPEKVENHWNRPSHVDRNFFLNKPKLLPVLEAPDYK